MNADTRGGVAKVQNDRIKWLWIAEVSLGRRRKRQANRTPIASSRLHTLAKAQQIHTYMTCVKVHIRKRMHANGHTHKYTYCEYTQGRTHPQGTTTPMQISVELNCHVTRWLSPISLSALNSGKIQRFKNILSSLAFASLLCRKSRVTYFVNYIKLANPFNYSVKLRLHEYQTKLSSKQSTLIVFLIAVPYFHLLCSDV